jgi:hypothetical protein
MSGHRPAAGNDAALPDNTHHLAQYLRLRHSGVGSPGGISPHLQEVLPVLSPDACHPVGHDARTRGSIENDVANLQLGVSGRGHFQDITVPHRRVHARTPGAKAQTAPASQQLQGKLLELDTLTTHCAAAFQHCAGPGNSPRLAKRRASYPVFSPTSKVASSEAPAPRPSGKLHYAITRSNYSSYIIDGSLIRDETQLEEGNLLQQLLQQFQHSADCQGIVGRQGHMRQE